MLKQSMIFQNIVIIILIVLVLTLSGCSDKPPEVQGYIEANLTYVSTSESGKLVTLAVHRGEKIKTGQLLFKLEKAPLLYQKDTSTSELAQSQAIYEDKLTGKRKPYLKQLEADINKAKAKYNFDKNSFNRAQILYKNKNMSLQEFQQYTSSKDQSQAQLNSLIYQLLENKLPARLKQIEAQKEAVDAAQSKLELSQWKLDQINVSAPASGIIFDHYYWKGEQVKAYMPIVSILVPDQIKLIFFVSETQLSLLHLGKKIKFNVDGVVKPFNASINFISPQAEYTPPVIYSEQSRKDLVYRIEAKIMSNTTKQWHPGQPVTVIIPKEQ